MIELIDINKSFFPDVHAIKDLSLDIRGGETLVLLGSSGCGKTTILKMINRIIEPSSGTILIEGQNILEQDPIEVRRSIGYVIQEIGLFPHMNIEDNIAVVLKLKGRAEEERIRRANEVLELVGLNPEKFRSRYPDELSGGQQQRIGVARALAANPALLLMDEPFSAVDAVTRELLQQELLKLKKQLNKTIVFVTHDIFEAFTLANRIAILHEGQLQQVGTKEEIISSPETEFVEKLLMKPKKQLSAFQGLI
ncbi:MAG: ATP-binding cassette domain-containing protein [Planctomycetota bacterium]|jgi:osmoprotectant transport system ATP-binding protein